MNTFSKHTTLIVLVGTSCFATSPKHSLYAEGKKQAHQLIELLNCTDEAKAQELAIKSTQLIAPEFLEACNTMQKESVGSPAYKKAFTQVQDFYRGTKEVLQNYTLPLEVEQKQALLTMSLCTADIYLDSTDHFEATKKIGEAISKSIKTNQNSFPQLPKLQSFKANRKHTYYKEGYNLVKNSYVLVDLQAQGKDIPVEKQLALNKESTEFMQKEFSKLSPNDKSQYPVIAENMAQYLAGAEKALKEYPLEKTLKKYNTDLEQADKLRLAMKTGLEMFTSIKNMLIQGDLSKFSELGSSLQQFGNAGAKIAKS